MSHASAIPLASLPTELSHRADTTLDVGQLWLKNDARSGPFYGGNKVRKLEYLLADARQQGASVVETCGAIGSNHCLATAIYASREGFDVTLHHFPQEVTAHVRKNLRALSRLSVRLEHHGDIDDWLTAIQSAEQKAEGDPDRYWVPAGGTTPRAALGFVAAARELKEQLAERSVPFPDRIYVAAGTAGTLVGLTVGLALLGAPTEVVGVRVTPISLVNESRVSDLIGETLALCEQPEGGVTPRWSLRHEFLGRGYGQSTAEAEAATESARAQLGIEMETTYTAKCFAALLHDASEGELSEKRVMYWHTLNGCDLDLASVEEARERLPATYAAYL